MPYKSKYEADENVQTDLDLANAAASKPPQDPFPMDVIVPDFANPRPSPMAHPTMEEPPMSPEEFLQLVDQLESSGNKNTNHPIIQKGPQAGQQAIGRYGLLPPTIQELNKRAAMEKSITPEMQELSRNPASIREKLTKDPELEKLYAERLANHILSRISDPEMAAYAWNSGHNLTPEKIEQRDYKNNPYVEKFRRIRSKFAKLGKT